MTRRMRVNVVGLAIARNDRQALCVSGRRAPKGCSR
jgi:hypothetical protein